MYTEFETKTSYKYLNEVIGNLSEPICIIGGWAVFFHANARFQEEKGRPYLGSRDIDLGFQIKEDIENSVISSAIKSLKKLKFQPVGFRFLKEIHTETKEEIKKGNKVPAHFIFPMYVDLVVDSIPKNFKKTFGFDPIDEPLLKPVFEKKKYVIVKEFGKKLLLPNVEYLIAMKITSLPKRDKNHKKIKDICDLFVLSWYTDIEIAKIDLSSIISEKKMNKCSDSITKDDLENASQQIDSTPEEIKRIIDIVCKK